jgi:hypothetical protein
LLANVLFAKYGLHLPFNRQSTTYAREGIDLDVSTLADWVGACGATLMPLVEAIRTHVFAAKRIHADDTTVPVLAKGKTRTGRTCVTTGRSVAQIRLPRHSSTRATAAASILNSIWPVTRASCLLPNRESSTIQVDERLNGRGVRRRHPRRSRVGARRPSEG